MFSVLLVDDEAPIVERLLAFDWAAHDCRVIGTASNGRDALRKCDALLPSIVVSDIVMPLMDGIDLMREVNRKHPEILFILLTVHKSFDFAYQAICHDALDYVIKDMDLHQTLTPAIKKACKKLASAPTQLSNNESVLRLDASRDTTYNRAYIAEFLNRSPNVLVGVRVSPVVDSVNAFYHALRSRLNARFRLILRDENAFELLLDDGDVSAHLSTILSSSFRCALYGVHSTRDYTFVAAYANGVIDTQSYESARKAVLFTLDRHFYAPHDNRSKQTTITPAIAGCSKELEADRVTGWLARINALTAECSSNNEVVAFLEKDVFSVAQSEEFVPARLKWACLRILHSIEMRYADAALTETRKAILDASDFITLRDALMSGVKSLLPRNTLCGELVKSTLIYLSEHFSDENCCLRDAAAYVYVSPAHLSRKLKEETGKAFQSHLTDLRMKTAAEYIRHTRSKVYEIAKSVGYANYRSFVNAFVNYYGVSPQQFR